MSCSPGCVAVACGGDLAPVWHLHCIPDDGVALADVHVPIDEARALAKGVRLPVGLHCLIIHITQLILQASNSAFQLKYFTTSTNRKIVQNHGSHA
jgi:hypothetical protein